MSENVVKVHATAPEAEPVARAAALLRGGGLVAFPTETVYGLGAHALDAAAVQRIFEAKGRPSYNPLIVHVAAVAGARRIVADWPELAERAAAAFWPGPLTLVLPKQTLVPAAVTAGLATVAVRVPSHPVALALLAAADVPIAAPSANRFTRVSPTTAAHVARGLGERVDLILDGGATPFGIESTVLDLTTDPPSLLRPGVITLAELEAVLGAITPAAVVGAPDRETPLRSPGMLERHYSPDAELVVVADAAAAAAAAARARADGRRVGAVVMRDLPAEADQVVALPADARGYARLFYAALHTLDEAGCDVVLVEAVPEADEWHGVRDRLRRAAGARSE